MADRKRARQREITPPRARAPSDEEFMAWLDEPPREAAGPSRKIPIHTPESAMRQFAETIYAVNGLPVHPGPLIDCPRYILREGRAAQAQEGDLEAVSLDALGERLVGPDTEAALAGLVLNTLRMMEIARRDNAVDLMMRQAFRLGSLMEIYSIEFEFGPILSNLDGLEQGRIMRARKAKAAAEKRQAEWQAIADEIWSRKPTFSRVAVAQIISKQTGEPVSTIRQKLIRPEQT